MRRKGISIAGLMGLVLAIALEFAAIRGEYNIWPKVSGLGAATFLLFATLRAGLGNVRHRAFWLVFAAIGWTHMYLSTSPYKDVLPTNFLAIHSRFFFQRRYETPSMTNEEKILLREAVVHQSELIWPWVSVVAGLIGGLIAARMDRSRGRGET